MELARWRDFSGLPMNIQPQFFPVAGDDASRLITAVQAIVQVTDALPNLVQKAD